MKNEIQTAWSKAVNDKTNWSYKDKFYGNKVPGKLTAMHYMVYNVARGLPIDRGFSTDSEAFNDIFGRFDRIVDRMTLAEGRNLVGATNVMSGYTQFFGETLDLNDFMEKAYEALRIYRCS